MSVTRPAQKPVPQPLGMFQNTAKDHGCRAAREQGGPEPRAPGYLDGGGAALLVLALTQQAVGLHVVAGYRHGLHHVQAIAGKRQTGRWEQGPRQQAGREGRAGQRRRGSQGVGRTAFPTHQHLSPAHPNQLSKVHLWCWHQKCQHFPNCCPQLPSYLMPCTPPRRPDSHGLVQSKDFQVRAGEAQIGVLD